MDISISTGLYYTKTYDKILDIISHTPCKSIELFLNQAFLDVPERDLEKALSIRNLEVSSIHTPLEFLIFPKGETEDYWIGKSIKMARRFGAKLIVSHMVSKRLDRQHKENIEKYRLTECITVTTENLPAYSTNSFLNKYDRLHEYITKKDIPLTFDTTHCATLKHPIIPTFLKFKNHVRNIHLSDFGNNTEHKILGTGDLPISEFIRLLIEEQYDGLLTLEYDFDNKKRNDIHNTEEAINVLNDSIDLIRNAASISY